MQASNPSDSPSAEHALTLMRAILSPLRATDQPGAAAFAALEAFVERKLPGLVAASTPPDASARQADLVDGLERLRHRLDFHPLTDKRVVGVGGPFSAGKSAFLNLLAGGHKLLPIGLRPTTSVPTYLVHAPSLGFAGLNAFGQSFVLEQELFELLTHRLGNEWAIGPLLRALMVEAPGQPYRYLAFLDTPGYSKADGGSAWRDATVARRQLKAVHAMCWLVEAATGITHEDLAFLQELGGKVPLLVVVTKCDKVPAAELPAIRASVEEALQRAGLPCQGVYLISREPKAAPDLPALREVLSAWDQPAETERFVPLQSFFFSHAQHLLAAEQRLDKRLWRLKQIWGAGDEMTEPKLVALQTEARAEARLLRERREALDLGTLQFFSLLGELARDLGLALPDPEELARCDDAPRSILGIVRKLKEDRGVKETDLGFALEKAIEDMPTSPVPRRRRRDVIAGAVLGSMDRLGRSLSDRLIGPADRPKRLSDRLASHPLPAARSPSFADRLGEHIAPEPATSLFTRTLVKVVPTLSR